MQGFPCLSKAKVDRLLKNRQKRTIFSAFFSCQKLWREGVCQCEPMAGITRRAAQGAVFYIDRTRWHEKYGQDKESEGLLQDKPDRQMKVWADHLGFALSSHNSCTSEDPIVYWCLDFLNSGNTAGVREPHILMWHSYFVKLNELCVTKNGLKLFSIKLKLD